MSVTVQLEYLLECIAVDQLNTAVLQQPCRNFSREYARDIPLHMWGVAFMFSCSIVGFGAVCSFIYNKLSISSVGVAPQWFLLWAKLQFPVLQGMVKSCCAVAWKDNGIIFPEEPTLVDYSSLL